MQQWGFNMNTQSKMQGYKFTEEFGYIPEDWEVKTLGDIANIKDGTHQTPKYVNNGIPFYSVENITNNDFKNTKFISLEEHKRLTSKYKIEHGDVLMTRIGSIGDCKYIDWVPDASFYVSLALLKIKESYSAKYITQFSNTSIFKKELDDNSLPFAIPKKINLGAISNVRVILPENKQEQEKIAEVLGDIDNLIDKTQQLINKKKDIKTATMQKLLTPKDNWNSYKLGNCSKICTGNENNENKVEDGLYPFFVRSEYVERINTYSFDGEAILVPGEGGIGKIFHYIKGKFNYHQRVYKISDFNHIDGKYTFYYMKQHFGKYALSNTVKATVDSLRLPTFEEFDIKCPDITEQKTIATILSDIDTEIEALEKELNKYQNLKTGIMQQLLTGKIRLLNQETKQDDNIVSFEHITSKKVANDEFKDAILISMLAYKYGTEQYPLGAFRRQKLSYFYKRHANMNIDEYTKKAMGPYNSKLKYQGAENIAIRNGYIKNVGGRGIIATEEISKIKKYYESYYKPEDMQWLDANFHYENNNNLEVLATVDYAINDLVSQNKAITLNNIKTYIASDKEWKPKLELEYFTDNAIIKAMEKIKKLFNSY